jgi:hypothetical protein
MCSSSCLRKFPKKARDRNHLNAFPTNHSSSSGDLPIALTNPLIGKDAMNSLAIASLGAATIPLGAKLVGGLASRPPTAAPPIPFSFGPHTTASIQPAPIDPAPIDPAPIDPANEAKGAGQLPPAASHSERLHRLQAELKRLLQQAGLPANTPLGLRFDGLGPVEITGGDPLLAAQLEPLLASSPRLNQLLGSFVQDQQGGWVDIRFDGRAATLDH